MRRLIVIDQRPEHEKQQAPTYGREPHTPVEASPVVSRTRLTCHRCQHHNCVCQWWRYYWEAYWEASPWGLAGAAFNALLALIFGLIILWALLSTLLTWGG